MDFNGNPVGASVSPLDRDLDANSYSVTNLYTINTNEISTPTPPINPNSVSYFTDTSHILNSIDDLGVVRTYVTSAGPGVANEIVATDLSCSIVCQNGGTIEYSGASHYFTSGSLILPISTVAGPTNNIFIDAPGSILITGSSGGSIARLGLSASALSLSFGGFPRFGANATDTFMNDSTNVQCFVSTPTFTRTAFGSNSFLNLTSTDATIRTNSQDRLRVNSTFTSILSPNNTSYHEINDTVSTIRVAGQNRYTASGSSSAMLSPNGTGLVSLSNTQYVILQASTQRFQINATECELTSPSSGGSLILQDDTFTVDLSSTNRILLDPTTTVLIDANTDPVVVGIIGSGSFLTYQSTSFVEIGATDSVISTGGTVRVNIDPTLTALFAPDGTTSVVLGNTGTIVDATLSNSDLRATSATTNLFYNGTATDIRLGNSSMSNAIDSFGRLTNNSNPVTYGYFGGTSTATTIGSSTTETDFFANKGGNANIRANELAVGSCIKGEIAGTVTTGLTTLRIRVRGGVGGITGAIMMDTGAIAVPVSGNWSWSFTLNIRQVGAGGVAIITGSSQFFNGGVITSNFTNTTTFDTTVQNTISITGQWSLVGSSITRNMGYVSRVA